ncbi:MAG: YneF family protein [Erysipelotrichales bacterium]|nr:YneF family protein [Erysipelotrichales bacterium]
MIILAGFDWTSILYLVGGLIGGGIGGFFLARHLLKKELAKNPPINENMIRAMFMQMGRKPSEKQIREVMRQMEKNK